MGSDVQAKYNFLIMIFCCGIVIVGLLGCVFIFSESSNNFGSSTSSNNFGSSTLDLTGGGESNGCVLRVYIFDSVSDANEFFSKGVYGVIDYQDNRLLLGKASNFGKLIVYASKCVGRAKQ